MRFILTALMTLLSLPATGAWARPIRDGTSAVSCPDPTVLDAHVGRYRYYVACTSDFDPDSFPIRGSNDLVHWRQVGYVFPDGHQPWWAVHSPHGRYWAPALYRIQGHWVLYFAAQYNAKALTLRDPKGVPVPQSEWVIGVATSRSLSGPWQTKVLHFRGQFNGVVREQESYGGVIDPSVVQDRRTGQRYLFYAEQHSSIWVTKLSADGLRIDPNVHQVLWTQPGWECDTPNHKCVVEGPEEYYRNGWFYLFYSGGSTWSGSYAVGLAASADPMQAQFRRLSASPILQSGPQWVGPGGTSAPVVGPDGNTYLFYHAEAGPNLRHNSANRFLFSSPISWQGLGGYLPLIGNGKAG
jgi:arabinan endo-1,5-alpha-L-arabinosidase